MKAFTFHWLLGRQARIPNYISQHCADGGWFQRCISSSHPKWPIPTTYSGLEAWKKTNLICQPNRIKQVVSKIGWHILGGVPGNMIHFDENFANGSKPPTSIVFVEANRCISIQFQTHIFRWPISMLTLVWSLWGDSGEKVVSGDKTHQIITTKPPRSP